MVKKEEKTKKVAKVVEKSILGRACITEKAAQAQKNNTYIFTVAPSATKSEIAKAFENVYKQKPVKVNFVTGQRKSVFIKGKLGFKPKFKKAYISLKKGVTIEVL